MKKRIVVLVIIVIVSFLFGCSKQLNYKESVINMDVDINNFVNNERVVHGEEDLQLKTLQDYFGDSERKNALKANITLSNVLNQFDVKYLRMNNVGQVHVTFPTEEGGNFIVFFALMLDGDFSANDFVFWDYIYAYELQERSNITYLEKGMTYQQVQTIFPCTRFISIYSSGPVSYSPLLDKNVLVCRYVFDGDDYILNEYNVTPVHELESVFTDTLVNDIWPE